MIYSYFTFIGLFLVFLALYIIAVTIFLMYQEYRKLPEATLSRSKKIVKDAEKKADAIVQGMSTVVNDLERKMDLKGGKTMREFDSGLQTFLEEQKKTFMDKLRQSEDRVDLELISMLHKTIAQQEKRIQEEYDQYKQSRMQALDDEIIKVVQEKAKKIFPGFIPEEQHIAKIKEALDRSKKEGLYE